MKWYRITGFIILYILLSAKGCNEGGETREQRENRILESRQDIEIGRAIGLAHRPRRRRRYIRRIAEGEVSGVRGGQRDEQSH